MSMGHGMGPVWRHMRTDRSITEQRLHRDTVRRVLQFALPHRTLIGVFLAITVIDAAMVVVTPLLVSGWSTTASSSRTRDSWSQIAVVMAAVAVFIAGLTVIAGYLSSRIGEGLIYDLRTTVFAHVQRMSLAFFTRTQTGALVSRLNNDVIGAQRAFTSTLSSTVANSISAVVVGVTMFALNWQITLACLAMFPLAPVVSRWVGNRLGEPDPTPDGRQRRAEQHHDRTVQRRRGAAAQAVRPTRRGGLALRREGRDRARPRRPDLTDHPGLCGRA